ncbi:MAG: ABC transporter permease [Calditrichaceae bacterium]|nr:ABC transporter permease [Calditrichaceae bacterium]
MKEIWTIIKREYRESVYKKSFLILTLITPVLMIALGVLPTLFFGFEEEKPVHFNVIDESNVVYDKLSDGLSDTLKDGSAKFFIKPVAVSSQMDSVIRDQRVLIDEEKTDGLLYIPASILDSNQVIYYTKNVANFDVNYRIKDAVEKIVRDHRIEKSGLNLDYITKLTQSVDLKTYKVVKGGEQQERGFGEEYFGTFVFVLILYMTLIFNGTSIMRSIILEKSTRVIEVLLSTTSAFKMMAGKIVGQGFVGITQYIIWAIFGILLVLYGNRVLPVSSEYLNFSPEIFIYFVLFYILGYFVYAILFAAIGAMVNTDQEGQQISFPVIMLLVVPIMILGLVVKNPDSTMVTTISLIPFFSPIIMFARINLTSPGFMEIGGSIILLILTIIFLIWLAAKIYRVGILMYGKRPNLPEIIKWMRIK